MPATYNSDGCYICYLCDEIGLTENEMIEHVTNSKEHSQRTLASRTELCDQWKPRIAQLPHPKRRQQVEERLQEFVQDPNMDMDCIQERYEKAQKCLATFELEEGAALLEMAVWKRALSEPTMGADRLSARIRSGVDVIVGNVVQFCK